MIRALLRLLKWIRRARRGEAVVIVGLSRRDMLKAIAASTATALLPLGDFAAAIDVDPAKDPLEGFFGFGVDDVGSGGFVWFVHPRQFEDFRKAFEAKGQPLNPVADPGRAGGMLVYSTELVFDGARVDIRPRNANPFMKDPTDTTKRWRGLRQLMRDIGKVH